MPADRAREVYGPLPGLELELKETYFGDALFLVPAWTLAAGMSNVGVPAWLYYYSYVNEGERGQVPGAAHGAEVSHLFRHPLRPGIPLGSRDLDVSEPLRRYWVQFAHSGNPNGPGLPEWPVFTRAQPKVMEFGETAHVLPMLFPGRISFHRAAVDVSGTIRR